MIDNDFIHRTIHRTIHRRAAIALVTMAATGLLGSTAIAQRQLDLTPRSVEAREYSACMRLAKTSPKAAQQTALAWRKRGGGDPALHCVAVALLSMGQYSQSARMLEELAAGSDAKRPDLRAGLLAQAANGWIIAGRPQTAVKLLGQALALRPTNVEMMIDRSIALVSLGKYWDALDDLNRALELAPGRIDAMTFRASAWRQVKAFDLARQDIDAVLTAQPETLDALLERGLIRKAQGDKDGARADWLKVLELAVKGPQTDAARRNIEIMDVKKK
jgi:tetratricopeptide (TPR) repeat protein